MSSFKSHTLTHLAYFQTEFSVNNQKKLKNWSDHVKLYER